MQKSDLDQTSDIYQMLMDSLSVNIAIYKAVDDGEDFVFIDFNKAAEKTDNIKKEELIGKRLNDVFPGVKKIGLFDVFQRVYKTGIPEVFEPTLYQDDRIRGWRKNEVRRLANGNIITMYEDYTEHKLLESEVDSLGEIIDNSLNEVYIFDCYTLEFTYVNQGALNNLGYSYKELMQMTPLDIKPFHTEESFTTLLKPLCDGTEAQIVLETVHRRKDMSTYDIEVRLQHIRKGNKDQIVAMGIDITNRKHTENILQESLKSLANTEKIAHFGGWNWDMRTNTLQWSDEVFRIFGEVPQSFNSTYKTFLSYLSDSDKKRVKRAIKKALQSKSKYEIDHKIILKDGTERFVREIGEFSYDEDGNAIKLIGGVMDVTEYTLIKEALQEQEKIYSQLFHQSTDGMMISDDQTRTVDYNEALLKMLKYESSEALLGKEPFELSPKYQSDGELSSEKQKKMLKKIFAEGPQHFEWQLYQSDGNLIWTDVKVTPIRIDKTWKIHAVIRDITERKKMEAELESFNKYLSERVEAEIKKNEEKTHHMLQQSRLAQMGEMISMIAHQWRQPLSSISAIAGTLTMDSMMGEYKKEFFEERLDAITELSQHLSSTIDDFRGFFKEDKELKMTSLLEIVHSSLLIIGPTLTSKGIEVEDTTPDTIRLMTYPNEIIQVLLNLFKNSEESIEEKKVIDGKISIKGYMKDEMACLSIEDNAGGIPEDLLEKVFEPYFSTKRKKDGTGLGLYMSKTIIEEHCGGNLRLENSNTGALFKILLPIQANEKDL